MIDIHPQSTTRARRALRLGQCLPVLLPLAILIGTGVRGLDFGLHWDERPWQIGPIKHMVQSSTPLPGYYNYPSFDYWLNLLALSPDAAIACIAGENLRQDLLRVLDSHAFLLRLRMIYLVITSLTVLWTYLLVLQRGGSLVEALLAALFLTTSWEVAYHLRWVATDGMLMQFAALTALLSAYALETGRERWLIAAAAAAGLGFGTKYPGGLLILPVLLAACLSAVKSLSRKAALRLVKPAVVFVAVYLATTPATILRPAQVMHAVFFEAAHYSMGGHAGHAVGRGIEHSWRMLVYFSTVLFSHFEPIALFVFALSLVGLVRMLAQNRRATAVFVAFPLLYLLYFSMQRAMIVRNVLATVPFFAVAAARGAIVVGELLNKPVAAPVPELLRKSWIRVAWTGLLVIALSLNVSWLIQCAESIRDRHTDRFVRETANYVNSHKDKTFLLSPRVQADLAAAGTRVPNVTSDPGAADMVVLYAREGMRHWHDWPANRPNLTRACFGPREVNLNIYPNWWGNDHIMVIERHRADEIKLHIAGISPDTPPLPSMSPSAAPAEPPSQMTPLRSAPLPANWSLPDIDPRVLVGRAEAKSVIGPLIRGPAIGGWELDGDGCSYFAQNGIVVSVVIISTSAFGLERYDPGTTPISNVGRKAYLTATGPFGDVRLFARSVISAVIVHVSGGAFTDGQRADVAQRIAGIALARLDEEQTRHAQPGHS